jgi:hypothetical protein
MVLKKARQRRRLVPREAIVSNALLKKSMPCAIAPAAARKCGVDALYFRPLSNDPSEGRDSHAGSSWASGHLIRSSGRFLRLT